MIIIFWILITVLLFVWIVTGILSFVNRLDGDELPEGFKNNFYFHLTGGPISWCIGVGRVLYYIMEKT